MAKHELDACWHGYRRAGYSYGEGKSAVECAMSYSALGEHMEAWYQGLGFRRRILMV
jgi:hypothetical protein